MEILDLDAQLKWLKSSEGNLAFCGFMLQLKGRPEPRAGVLKVGGTVREDGSGYLVLTFLIDYGEDRDLLTALVEAFMAVDMGAATATEAEFGPGFEYILTMQNPQAERAKWFMKEVTFNYSRLDGLEKRRLDGDILPMLEQMLPIEFEEAQWFDD